MCVYVYIYTIKLIIKHLYIYIYMYMCVYIYIRRHTAHQSVHTGSNDPFSNRRPCLVRRPGGGRRSVALPEMVERLPEERLEECGPAVRF